MTDGSDGSTREPRRRVLRLLPWVAVAAVMIALTAVAVDRVLVSETEEPTEADTVQDVADLAAEATEALDVQQGVAMLCRPPIQLYQMTVESTIDRWRSLTGDQAPDVTAEVSDVDSGSAGSFVLRISSDEDGLEDEGRTFRVYVEHDDGRSCVTGVGGPKSRRPSTVFAADGYTGVTSPPPEPTSEPSSEPSP